MKNTKELKIEYLKTSELKFSTKELRRFSKEEIAVTTKVIKHFGMQVPIIIDKNCTIIIGIALFKAASNLNLDEVPTVKVEYLNDKELQMFTLAINKISMMGELDLDSFKYDIKEWLFDIDLDITPEELGFTSIEMDNLLFKDEIEEQDAKKTADENLPKDVPAIVKPGDLIQLGRHLLYCGDALSLTSYQILMKNEKADIAITDAPYNVKIQGNVTRRKEHGEFAQASGEMTSNEFTNFLKTAFSNLAGFTKEASVHYLFMDWKHLPEIQSACSNIYKKLLNICVWNKMFGGMGGFYRSQHEFCLVYQYGSGSYTNNVQLGKNGRNRTNVWDYKGMSAINSQSEKLGKLHPTVKPLAMLVDILLDASNYGDIVLDCFGGSGSTLMAAQQCGRRARIIEISPQYCDVIIYRWEELTNEKHIILKVGEENNG